MGKTCRTCGHLVNGVCMSGKSGNWSRYMGREDSCGEWEETARYEIYRADASGKETFLANVTDAREIGKVIDRDRESTGNDSGWYRAVCVKEE